MEKTDLSKLLKDLENQIQKPVRAALMKVKKAKMVPIEVRLLKQAISANSDHPVAQSYAQGILGFPDDQQLRVDITDFKALVENRVIETATEIREEAEGTIRKILVKKLGEIRDKVDQVKEKVEIRKTVVHDPGSEEKSSGK